MLTANVEDGVSSKDTEDAFLEEESEEDNKEDCNGEEDQHGPNREPQNDVLDELELCEVNILKCMAKNWANSEEVWEKMRKLGQTEDHVRKNVQKVDKRDWVEVDHACHSQGVHRAAWMMKLQGYSCDLD
jgi:hypothetical protein